MARSFDGASQYIQQPFTGVTLPLTVAAWIYPFTSAPSDDMSIFFLGIPGDNTQWRRMLIEGNTGEPADGKLRWACRHGTTAKAISTNDVVANQWQHACGMEISTSSRAIYLNGTSDKGVNTQSRSPAAPTHLNMGHRGSIADDWYWGLIAHVAYWDVQLSDGEVDALAAGASPLRVRRDSLKHYWPLNGQNPEKDVVGGVDLTLYNAPPIVEEATGLWGNHIVAPGP